MSATAQTEPRLGEHAQPDQHSLARSVVLHLLPGALAVTLLYLTAPLVERLGLPPMFAFLLAVAAILSRSSSATCSSAVASAPVERRSPESCATASR